MVTLLGSLPDSFSYTCYCSGSSGLTLKYVQQALVNEEQKMREREHSNRSKAERQDSVLVGEHQKRKSRYQKPQGILR